MSDMEDRFFGVKTQIGSQPEVESEEFEVEIVDDRPEEDRKPPRAEETSSDEDEAELAQYGAKVRKRIDKLTYDRNEERRQRESAERMREEAVRIAQQLAQKNQEYESLIKRGESVLVSQIKERTALALEKARAEWREAYEQGDTERLVSAQEKLLSAQTEFREADGMEKSLQNRPVQPVVAPQPAPEVRRPDQKALDWAGRNPWFQDPKHPDMTSMAYGVHHRLITQDGVQVNSDEYFKKIDEAMRLRFPDYFQEDARETGRGRASSVVAPVTRSNGTRPQKIQLTATQVSLAKRLGLTAEQYARQLLKESGNG